MMAETAQPIQPQSGNHTPVIDYEGSGYRTDFWEGQGREYEDATERLALGKLLPPRGVRIAEIGAGFGRLADLYQGYEQIVLFDYSRTLLQDAARQWGADERFVFVAGNLYDLPLASRSLDTLVMVRVMHHLADVPKALAQLRRVLHERSVAVLEYANKRNVKAVARWVGRRQEWSPFRQEPVEFVDLNFDFHPGWMSRRLNDAGLDVRTQLAVSHFRLPLLKERIPAAQLAQIDSLFFGLGGVFPLAPSVFVQTTPRSAGMPKDIATTSAALTDLFRCPVSGAERFERLDEDLLYCSDSNLRFVRKNGVWDFKEPLSA